jgi:hypothetical protein
MVKWHTGLSDFETQQAEEQRSQFGGDVLVVVDESQWLERDAFYQDLESNRQGMLQYVEVLARIAGVERT